jgi:hypothetical protein
LIADLSTSRARADAIVLGTVVSSSETYNPIDNFLHRSSRFLYERLAIGQEPQLDWVRMRYSFNVHLVWKGPLVERLNVYTGMGTGDCGIRFRTGSRYLLFLDRSAKGRYIAHLCTRTSEASRAATDMEALGRAAATVHTASEGPIGWLALVGGLSLLAVVALGLWRLWRVA